MQREICKTLETLFIKRLCYYNRTLGVFIIKLCTLKCNIRALRRSLKKGGSHEKYKTRKKATSG